MNKFTKITASIGPASESKEVLKEMIKTGVNMCRLNFSHDTGDAQGSKIDNIREISKELDTPIAVLCDLQGPKHRIGNFKTDDKYPLTVGGTFILDNNPEPGDETRVQLPDEDVLNSLKAGDRVLLNDGKIEFIIEKAETNKLTAKVIRGTEIWSRRGFNLPDTEVATSVLTVKDREDLEYAITKNPDYIAISFVQKPEDVIETREFIKARTSHPIKIISKIERPNAVERFEEIVKVTDGIMIARGDLAVEVPFEKVPAMQRMMIRECRKHNKPVIVATQMLGSMVETEFPTRAEISDVSIAAYLRADSTMTSEETTIGDHPIKVVDTMARILKNAEDDAEENAIHLTKEGIIESNDWSYSIVKMAKLNKAEAIVIFAHDIIKTIELSCRRGNKPIIAVCKDQVCANQLALSRAVFPICNAEMFDKRDAIAAAAKFSITSGKLIVVEDETVTMRKIG